MHSHPSRTSGSASTSPPLSRAALVGAALVLVAYFASLHVLIVSGVAPGFAIALIIGPWLVALAATVPAGPSVGRSSRALSMVAAVVVLGVIAWTYGDRLVDHVDVVLYLENLTFLIMLSGVFAVTLLVGREPLITRLARSARGGHLPPQAEGYTRRVTIVWAAFFASMAMISTLLFATQSRVVWSTFVNLLIWPSMAVLFALEYAVRVRVLRDIAHVPMMSGIDAFRQRRADPVVTTSGTE